jgi:hypothetical protein
VPRTQLCTTQALVCPLPSRSPRLPLRVARVSIEFGTLSRRAGSAGGLLRRGVLFPSSAASGGEEEASVPSDPEHAVMIRFGRGVISTVDLAGDGYD